MSLNLHFQSKENISKEAVALKESLNIARSRSEWLESHMTDSKDELKRLRVVRLFSNELYHDKTKTFDPPILFEHTCAYARWAQMHRFLSVRPSVCLSVCPSLDQN